jgi:hypothetical protein
VVEERSKASVDGAGGYRRELLANDGADEGAVGIVWPSTAPLLDAERTYSFNKRGHRRVAAGEQVHKACVPAGAVIAAGVVHAFSWLTSSVAEKRDAPGGLRRMPSSLDTFLLENFLPKPGPLSFIILHQ